MCIRDSNTYAEHPETWRMGTNELVGEDPALLAKTMDTLMHGEWKRGELPEMCIRDRSDTV